METQTQTLATVATPQATGDEPAITISTIALDRDRDEIDPSGGDFVSYQRNPVVLFGHDRSSLPVGSTTRLEVVPGRGITARWRWLAGDAFADRVRNAFDQGILRAASVGFLPIESESNGRGGRRFTRWELLEWSLVPLPANPEAVRTLKGLGLWAGDDMVLEIADDVHQDDRVALEITESFAEELRRRATTRRHSEPYEPLYDVSAAEIRRLMRGIVEEQLQPAAIGRIVRETTTATLRRMTGMVD